MLAPEPFLEPRGTPLSVHQRLRGLTALGHKVDLVTYHVGEDVVLPNLEIHRIPALPLIREVPIGPSKVKPILDVLLFFVAIWLLLRRRYDVIHSHEEAAFLAVVLAGVFRTRHIYDMHSSLPRQLVNFGLGKWWPLVRLFAWWERLVINTCDAVIAVGTDLEAIVRGINRSVRVITIENMPVTANAVPAAPDADARRREIAQQLNLGELRPVVYTGTFETYQGLDLLLHSARIVVDANPRALFVIVGGKPHQVEHWQEEACKLGLLRHVHFVGMVPIEESVWYLDLAEVLVSPRTGGTSVPLKIYSYLHAGKPIVATRLLAHTTVLDDRVAHLVEPTPAALADGILAVLDDAQLGNRLGREARALAEERYSFAVYKEKLRYIYGAFTRPASLAAHGPATEHVQVEGPTAVKE
jgi:glycosyltransferase involved in cell wall biosynthesis